nr:DDE-type integrase/transposase/recombinase [Streptobacillus canis]
MDVVEGRYGVGRVHRKLLNLGYKINHKKVQRLMNKIGLLVRRPKSKYRSYKGEVGKVATNIIDRDFNATAPLQKCSTNISKFSFKWGKCYFSPILDMYSNEIISYHISLSPNLELVSRMLKKAFKKYPNIENLIFYSDQGWYINELKKYNIRQSMSRKSSDGVFFARLKLEMYYG